MKRTKVRAPAGELASATPIAPAHFELREDGSIAVERREEKRAPTLTFSDPARSLWLYRGNCFELLDAIAAKYPEGRFDAIFADPPYFLSNGGITCYAGRMVRVDKGDWDKSQKKQILRKYCKIHLDRTPSTSDSAHAELALGALSESGYL